MPDHSGSENGISRETFRDMDQNLREWTLYNRMSGLVKALNDINLRCPRQIEICKSEFTTLSNKIDTLGEKIDCVRRKAFQKYERLTIILSGSVILIAGILIGLGLIQVNFVRDHLIPMLY